MNLPEEKQRQFIMQMHVFPGINYYPRTDKKDASPIQQLWIKDYVAPYLKLMKKYEKFIFFNLASHIHRGKFSAPVSSMVPELQLKSFIMPSVSPIYDNNPGFSIIEFS